MKNIILNKEERTHFIPFAVSIEPFSYDRKSFALKYLDVNQSYNFLLHLKDWISQNSCWDSKEK